MKLDVDIRKTWIDKAQKEIKESIKSLSNSSNEELIMMGLSVLLDKVSDPSKFLHPREEAVRLKINRRLMRNQGGES